MSKKNQLSDIHNSGKSYIIYKSKKGFDLYTNFSKKIILNNSNITKFLSKKHNNISGNTDLYIGFFGYEILNNLINVKIPKQKNIKFPKGIFYKPEKKISLSNNLRYVNENKHKNSTFKININKSSYTKIFNKFKKKLKVERHIKLKFAPNIKQNQK